MKKSDKSHLSNRILSMVASIVAIMTAVLLTFHLIHMRRILEQSQIDEGIALAESIAGGSELGVLSGDERFLDSIFRTLMDHAGAIFIAAYDSQGRIIHSTMNQRIDLTLPPNISADIVSVGDAFSGGLMRLHDKDVADFYAPVKTDAGGEEWSESLIEESDGNKKAATRRTIGLIRLGLSRQGLVSAQRQSIVFSVTAAAVIATLSILIASLISRRITEPIARLENLTRRISDGDMEVDMEIASNDEVGSLASAFNSMASALKQTTVSKDYVDSVVSSMNDSLFVISPDRTIASINASASRLLGYEPSDLEGRSIDLIFPPSFNLLSPEGWQEIATGSALSNVDTHLLTKDGREVQASLSVAPMFDRQGKLRGAVGVARDVSEIQRLLLELQRRSEELEHHRVVLTSMLEDNDRARISAETERHKTQAAVDSMAEGLVMFSAAGELLLINPAARRMMRMGDEDEANSTSISKSLGLDISPFLSSDKDDAEARLLHDAIVGETVKHTIRIEGIPVGEPGRRVGSMLVLRDVTRERQLDEAKHELLTNVSHELRTPLAAISNILSNALVGVTGTISDKLRSHLEIAKINSKRLANIIDNLLDIASLDAGNVMIRREQTDFISLAEEVLESVEAEVAQKGIKLVREIPAEPLNVYCDPSAISQVIRNLLSNAIRFTPQDGIASLSIKHEDGKVEVAVTDSGVGIPIEDQRSIFERFHQVGRTYGPGEKGLGLGLPISRHLVELHGGSIGLTSTPNRGSRFHFVLPLHSSTELLEVYLADRLAEMGRGGAVPYLWTFSPKLAEGQTAPSTAEFMETAAERLESVVRELLSGTRHMVCHLTDSREVAAVITERSSEDADKQAEKIEIAVSRFSFTYAENRIVCVVQIGHIACLDPALSSQKYIEQARESEGRTHGEAT